jgi:CheY-like chemotaxis protein
VVDDDEQVVDVVTSILQGLGYKVTSSISAQEALLLFMEANYNFDLVLTDYTMPLMTGLDLCARIRKIRPDIPLILSSGGTEQITEESLRRAGINEYLPKPITFQGLAQVVRRALDQLRI